jgi:hypothetical protein
MDSKTYVCALCSQDFTRRYSAYRHNRVLHHGQGTIVRMIDYVIGRIAGEYNPANPLAYSSRYMQQASASSHLDETVFNPPLDARTSIAHNSSQALSSHTLHHNSEYNPSNRQPNSKSEGPFFSTPKSGFTTKLEEIERVALTIYGADEGQRVIKEISLAVIQNGGKEEILDRCLEELRNKLNMQVASRILSSTPAKETKRRPPLHGHHIEHLHLSDFSRTKLERIEEILIMKLKNEVAAFNQVEAIIEKLEAQPKRHDMILDLELELLEWSTQTK